ncbi:MAG: hypothetical protein PF638_03820 [Candidatus Delongbacteria bacterium]|jgi:hypothetical protein|nr:hypothetical protein [Candidatus Delongbacteria bacterium]
MINNIKEYLSKEFIDYYNFIETFKESRDEYKYNFMPDSDYDKIQDIGLRTNIYWKEIVYRVHIVILVSLFKTSRWIDSLNNNVNNYYGFCSNLRGLIESCADSFYTLRSVPLTIATDYKAIYESIHNKVPIVLTHDNLQSTLIHYISATKLNKDESKEYPKEFNAKQITEYLSSIKDGNEKIIFLYQFLCGISHPASEATEMFLFLHKGETIVCSDSNRLESELITGLLGSFKEVLTKMIGAHIINIIGTLTLLNKFDLKEINTNFAKNDDFKEHDSWKEIDKFINESIIKYDDALKTGNYE